MAKGSTTKKMPPWLNKGGKATPKAAKGGKAMPKGKC